MARHSFIRMSKLPDVRGRVDYISNQKRQEHLYSTYSTVEPEFWKYLSEQAQHDFKKSNQQTGKCIEARELIIALPESLQEIDSNLLLQLFTETFRQKYGVQCTAALHHNKTMTNYHIHLIFADRELLEKKNVKYAARNMFYDEQGRHVRTKKEVTDQEGNLRPGCRMIQKGEIYEMSWFSARKEIFKSKEFLAEVKLLYTDLINQMVKREEDKETVFDPSGPYLPTKKIGKNNPLADEIKEDNRLRQEWNNAVDQVLIAGGSEAEVTEFKQEEVVARIGISVKENGKAPGLLAGILSEAIQILKEFLDILMKKNETSEAHGEIKEYREITDKTGELRKETTIKSHQKSRGPRPDSRSAEMEFRKMDGIHQQLVKANRKKYALQKQQEELQSVLDKIPTGIFYRKDRKAMQERIAGLQRQIEQTNLRINMIPKQYGFSCVKDIEASYRKAQAVLKTIQQKQAAWDKGEMLQERNEEVEHEQKGSVLKKLTENRNKKRQNYSNQKTKDYQEF